MKSILGYLVLSAMGVSAVAALTMFEQNNQMYARMKQFGVANDQQVEKLRGIIGKSNSMGQGKPDITKHPVTREQCLEKAKQNNVQFNNSNWEKICGAKYMAPIYDRAKGQGESQAELCIDQFEFPNIPCDYPMTWTKTRDAALICESQGKRLCDAHEWEGSCAGDYHSGKYNEIPDYKGAPDRAAMTSAANNGRKKVWAYGNSLNTDICSVDATPSPGCNASQANICGSNTYPSGWSLKCVSRYGVYDQHGNAAEAMNLPMSEQQMGRYALQKPISDPNRYGQMELKGSWFVFKKFGTRDNGSRWVVHEDDCRWRAPNWHGEGGVRVMSQASHENYHLGFRCCKDRRN